ncbi:hypothetical protein V5P93_002708 [Actinokineospora auranticolor]|uniref:Uracil DNA glycosylase superfamily protein n=1 Tax=Actinokineospora auranticolor TaxID=155976 RepID=A0A2S6H096_9PSEU|nr:hypothetical protein [Actinokineospora auranticolor]PPK70846.1 hypothetical protein CLV40_10132 [Actinokineospora auranticolor]
MIEACTEEAWLPGTAPAVGVYPFGLPVLRRTPRLPDADRAAALVLGVYPSALHVRWRRPGHRPIASLAVDDEPTMFWTGDQTTRIDQWRRRVDWRDAWGTVGPAGPGGGSGRLVMTDVLEPLGLDPCATYFTDCVPTYFVKTGPRQTRAMNEYDRFALTTGLPLARLPRRPAKPDLVRVALRTEGRELLRQIREADAPVVITLGKEAADILAGLTGTDRVPFRVTGDYGSTRVVPLGGRELRWIPLIHPGTRHDVAWRNCHTRWVLSRR